MPIRAAIRLRAKTIVTSLSHGIYSDRLKSNIIINLCVTRVTLVLHKDRIALSKIFKDGKCTYKNTGSCHLY